MIVTVSSDNTIRLWDSQSYDQAVEFSSPIDQPLSVAAHPILPIFSCGFESGTMRVFDIEKNCLSDEFTQFNKPLRKLKYSPGGDLLVAVCEDGSVALHSVRRQHLP
jgi:WD40 repeat protein